jgi:hypothetical protein
MRTIVARDGLELNRYAGRTPLKKPRITSADELPER